jgi:hypothetical protein
MSPTVYGVYWLHQQVGSQFGGLEGQCQPVMWPGCSDLQKTFLIFPIPEGQILGGQEFLLDGATGGLLPPIL